MICSECAKAGMKSRVYPGLMTTTALHYDPFYDEEGQLHQHDPNVSTIAYRCSNGHSWEHRSVPCCWCGWPKKEGGAE
jgi:hypothetical protein